MPLAGPPHRSARAYVVVVAALLAVYVPDTKPQLTCNEAQHDVLTELEASKPFAAKTIQDCWMG